MKHIFSLLLVTIMLEGHAQPVSSTNLIIPEVGKPMADLKLCNIRYFKTKQAIISDFKGKWLLLDFWSTGCGACISSFNSKNEIQNELGDRIQVMLVNTDGNQVKMVTAFEKYRKKMGLNLPSAFDSVLANSLDYFGLPYIILVDPDGIVQAVTTGLNKKLMDEFLSGGHPQVGAVTTSKSIEEEKMAREKNPLIPYNPAQPFLVNGNGAREADFVLRSVLSEFDESRHHYSLDPLWNFDEETFRKTGRFEILGASLERLYKFAFIGSAYWSAGDSVRYGKYYPQISFQTKDSGNFQKLYSYSLILPKERASLKVLQEALQKDLSIYFGYNAALETKIIPTYSLVADPSAPEALKRTSDPKKVEYLKAMCPVFINRLFSEVFNWISMVVNDTIIEDRTNITGNVNLNLDCTEVDRNGVIKALGEHGFHLIPAQKEMKVLTIGDPQN